MAGHVMAFLGQKGGAGKSRLAQAFATEFTRSGVPTLIADMEDGPVGSEPWSRLRAEHGWKPVVKAKRIGRGELATVLNDAEVIVLDTPGFADRMTRDLARASTLVVVPSGTDIGDLHPAVDLMHQLAKAGIAPERMVGAVVKAATVAMGKEAKKYLSSAGYAVLDHMTIFATAYAQAFNVGKAMTEVDAPVLRAEAMEQVKDLRDALKRTVQREVYRSVGGGRSTRTRDDDGRER